MNPGRAQWVWPLALLSVVLFIVFKWSWLQHPYYWDEAWSYGRAVHQQARQGLSVAPAQLDPVVFRGHPPLFYVLISGGLALFGISHVTAHAVAFCISLVFAGMLWWLTRRQLGDTAAALLLPVLLVNQPFYALATRVYPELLLGLWCWLAFQAYLENRKIALTLTIAAALLTKESGICLPVALIMYHVIGRRPIQALGPVLTGTAIALGWYAWQYSVRGWWLFPEHSAAVSLEVGSVAASIGKKIASLLLKDGRFLLFLPALAGAFWLRRQSKETIPVWLRHYTALGGLFLLVYLLFSAANFESSRYSVVANMVAVPLAWYWLWTSLRLKPYILAGVLLLFVGSQVKELAYPPTDKETSTGYLALLTVWQEAVAFCEQHSLRDGAFSAGYLATYALSDPEMGYLTHGQPFMLARDSRTARYWLFDSTDPGQMEQTLSEMPAAVLLWETRHGQHWAKIFEKK